MKTNDFGIHRWVIGKATLPLQAHSKFLMGRLKIFGPCQSRRGQSRMGEGDLRKNSD